MECHYPYPQEDQDENPPPHPQTLSKHATVSQVIEQGCCITALGNHSDSYHLIAITSMMQCPGHNIHYKVSVM